MKKTVKIFWSKEKQAELLRLQDPSQKHVENLNNVRRKISSSTHIKEDVIGGICGTHADKEKAYSVLVGHSLGREASGDGRITLKWMVKEGMGVRGLN